MAATFPRRLQDHTPAHTSLPGGMDQSRSLSTHGPGSGEGRLPLHSLHQPASRERDEDLSAILKHAHKHCSVPVLPAPSGNAPNNHPDRNSPLLPRSASGLAPKDCTADTEAIPGRFQLAPPRPRHIRMGMEQYRPVHTEPWSSRPTYFIEQRQHAPCSSVGGELQCPCKSVLPQRAPQIASSE